MLVSEVTRALVTNPWSTLIRRWNWKLALLSGTIRATVFLGATASTPAAVVEFALGVTLAGLGGALAQAYRTAQPRRMASLTVATAVPLTIHFSEILIHSLRGTPHTATGVKASMLYSCVSALFTLHAMREGAMLAGEEQTSILADLRRIPSLVVSFVSRPLRRIKHS
jgi:dipeptide/tripeptide permease